MIPRHTTYNFPFIKTWIQHVIMGLVCIILIPATHAQPFADGTVVSAGSRIKYSVSGLENSVYLWTMRNSEGEILSEESSGDTVYTVDYPCEPGNYTLQVQEMTQYGCDGSLISATVEVTAPYASAEDLVGLCYEQSHTFDPIVDIDQNKPVVYSWLNPFGETVYGARDYMVENESKRNRLESLDLMFRVGYYNYDSTLYCSAETNATVEYYPFNPINFFNGDTTEDNNIKICTEEPRFIYPGDYDIYNWSTGDISDQIAVDAITQKDSTRSIWVNTIDEYGCAYNDTITILACNVMEILKNIPNAFSPEKNGEKQVWRVEELEQFPGARLEIFDRWGRLIFSTNDASNEFWDGTYKGKLLPADSYYYVIDLNTPDQSEPVAGSVSLVY